MGRRLLVPGTGRELVPGAVEWVGERDRKACQTHRDQFIGDGHVVPGEPDNLLDLLGEDEYQDRRRTVTRR
jgi:hypothetical protein